MADSDSKPTPEENAPPAAGKDVKKASFFSKMGSMFSRDKNQGNDKSGKATEKNLPAPKKGQSAFLKNFKVKEVGDEAEKSQSTKTEAGKTEKPTEQDWTRHVGEPDAVKPPQALKPAASTIGSATASGEVKPRSTVIGPDESSLEQGPATESKALKQPALPEFKAAPGQFPPVTPSTMPPSPSQVALSSASKELPKPYLTGAPKSEPVNKPAVPSIKPPKAPTALANFPPAASKTESESKAKPAPKIGLPALPLIAGDSTGKVAPPSGGLPKPPVQSPVKPAPTSDQAAAPRPTGLLPGQKSGQELGTGQPSSSLSFPAKSPQDPPSKQSLPSLPPQANPAKPSPEVTTAASSGPTPDTKTPLPAKKAGIVTRISDLPAPSRKSTTTGTIKKESIRLKKTQAQLAEKNKTGKEPEFSSPAIPLGLSGKIPNPRKSSVESKPSAAADAKAKELPRHPQGLSGFNPPPVKTEQTEKMLKPAGQPQPSGVVAANPKPEPSAKAKESPKPEQAKQTASHKKTPKVVLPPVREESQGSKKILILIPLIILLLAGIAFAIYWAQRETAVEVTVQAGERTVRSEALVVLNFAGKLEMLRNDYFRRRTPVEEEINLIKANLSAAKGDLAGLEQRKKLLEEMLEQNRAEIPTLLNESQQALDSLWQDESAGLSKEYDDFKESLHKQIEDRAAELGVDYKRNTDIDAIAVAVNAYRLALYGVAQKVEVGEQRAWAEGLLQQWNAFEKKWRERQSEIKEKALAIKKDPIPKITEARKRIDNREREIDALDSDLSGLRNEVSRYELNLQEAIDRLQAIDKPFYEELRRIPEEFKVSGFPITESGQIMMPNLQEHPDLSAGTHFIMVTAVKGDEEFWAIQEFEVLPYQTVMVSIDPDRFVDLKTILEKGTFMNP
jgi:hypothetical protein